MHVTAFDDAYSNNSSVLAEKLSRGLDPNSIHPCGGHSLLQAACEANSLDAIAVLLTNGADPNLRFDKVIRTDGRFYPRRTALIYAQSERAIDQLVRAGADIDAIDGLGWKAIAHAVAESNVEGFRALLAAGARPSLSPDLSIRYRSLLDIADERIWQNEKLTSIGGKRHKRLGAALEIRNELAIRADMFKS